MTVPVLSVDSFWLDTRFFYHDRPFGDFTADVLTQLLWGTGAQLKTRSQESFAQLRVFEGIGQIGV